MKLYKRNFSHLARINLIKSTVSLRKSISTSTRVKIGASKIYSTAATNSKISTLISMIMTPKPL